MINTAVVGLGSNIRPRLNIRKAVAALSENYEVVKKSRFVRTKPVGYTKQADFLNGAVLLKTKHGYRSFRKELKRMEKDLGRTKEKHKFGPRSIDLDIIVWNDAIVDKDFYRRPFIKRSVLSLKPRLRF